MFETLKGRIPKSIDEDEYRKFAVMVALLKQEDGLRKTCRRIEAAAGRDLSAGRRKRWQ